MHIVLPPRRRGRRTGRDSPLRGNLRKIFAEGVSWSVMVGIGETYFPAFALALGMGEVWSGLIATVPFFAGGCLQLATPYGVNLLRSRRRWVRACATLQALSFIPLLVAVAVGHLSVGGLFLVASIYWGAGMAAGPAWNAWMDALVPRPIRARYFSRRSRATQVGVLVGLLAGGSILDATSAMSRPLLGFGILFGLAALARVISSRLVSAQTEPHPPLAGERIVGGLDLARRARHRPEGRLILYLALMTAAVSLASPFFTPYMLRRLEFSYTQYMTLIGASFAAKAIALTFLGKLAPKVGTLRLLRITAIGLALIPGFWILIHPFTGLLVLQLFAGLAWAGHEFTSFLLFFDAIPREERTSLLTTLNLANAAATVGGSLLGGALIAALPAGNVGYTAVFALSGAARLGAFLYLIPLAVGREPALRISFRAIALRPSAGAVLRPIWASIERLTSENPRPNIKE